MSITDTDFQLTHEELIKAVKILLYRFNLQSQKVTFERKSLAKLIELRLNKVEQASQSQLKEVSDFLHVVHADFENFIENHKKEHIGLNTRNITAAQEIG